jgi:hypothetical protein
MIKILQLFNKIDFHPDKKGIYFGMSFKDENGKTKFEFKEHYLICTVNLNQNPKVLFQVLYNDISIGTLIFLLQEYGIINYEFVKELSNEVRIKFSKEVM